MQIICLSAATLTILQNLFRVREGWMPSSVPNLLYALEIIFLYIDQLRAKKKGTVIIEDII